MGDSNEVFIREGGNRLPTLNSRLNAYDFLRIVTSTADAVFQRNHLLSNSHPKMSESYPTLVVTRDYFRHSVKFTGPSLVQDVACFSNYLLAFPCRLCFVSFIPIAYPPFRMRRFESKPGGVLNRISAKSTRHRSVNRFLASSLPLFAGLGFSVTTSSSADGLNGKSSEFGDDTVDSSESSSSQSYQSSSIRSPSIEEAAVL